MASPVRENCFVVLRRMKHLHEIAMGGSLAAAEQGSSHVRFGVNRVVLTARRSLPVFPDKQTFSDADGMSQRVRGTDTPGKVEADRSKVRNGWSESARLLRVGGGLGPNRAFSTRGRRVRVRPSRNENIGATLQHRFAALIAQENSGANDSPIGFGFRLPHLQNRRFEIELITRAYRLR